MADNTYTNYDSAVKMAFTTILNQRDRKQILTMSAGKDCLSYHGNLPGMTCTPLEGKVLGFTVMKMTLKPTVPPTQMAHNRCKRITSLSWYRRPTT